MPPANQAPQHGARAAYALADAAYKASATGDFAAAARDARQALQLQPDNADYRRLLAYALLETGAYADVEALAGERSSSDPAMVALADQARRQRAYVEFEAATLRGSTAGRIGGIVVSARERRSQKGNKFAFALFSDTSGQYEAVVFSETLANSRHLLESGKAVLLDVEGERDGEALKMRVQSVKSLDEAVEQIPRTIRILVDGDALHRNPSGLEQLKSLLRPGKGEALIELRLADYDRPVPIAPKGRYDLSAKTIGRITTVPGVLEVIET